MEEKNDDNKEQINIIIEKRIPKSILLNLFKDYQNLDKGPALEDINNGKNRKNTINDLKIQNEDDISKAITNKLEEIKNNSISRISNSINKYKTNYEIYKKKITKFIEEKEDKLSQIINNNFKNEVILKYVIDNIFNRINHIIEINDNIMNNIEDNFELLNNFLENSELIDQKKPREYYLNNNFKYILNCSLLNKFNFKEIDNMDIIKNNYYKYYFKYLTEEKNGEIKNTFILKKEENKKKDNELQYINQKLNTINNLKIYGIDSVDLDKIFNINEKQKVNNSLKKVAFKEFDFTKKMDLEKLKKIKMEFNKIEKIKFNKGEYFSIALVFYLFLNKPDSLINLSLEKVNMSNIGFNKLMLIFKKKPKILETLEYLSLAGNSISVVKADIFKLDEMKDKLFKNLKIMNFRKNNIYKFEIGLNLIPKLQLLDLSSNSIITGTIMENMIKAKDKLILFNDNIFITNNYINNNTYIEYLNKQFPNLKFGLKILHLEFTYDIEKQELLEKLKLSPSMKISLIKLDLSFCGITSDVLANFLKNNYGLFSLQKLKLKYNNLDSKVFEKLVSNQIYLEKLNILDLSENDVPCKEYEESVGLIKFIEKHKNLEKIKFMNSSFIDRWTTNISPDLDIGGKYRQLYVEFKDNLIKDNRKFIFIIDNENWNFVEQEFNHLFSFVKI